MWTFGLFNQPYMGVVFAVIMLILTKRVSEKELKQEFHFAISKSKDEKNTLKDEINNQEISIMKNFVVLKKIDNKIVINNIIDHYRSLNVPKYHGVNFWTVISLIISLLIPFINKDGMDMENLAKILPYFISLIIVCAVIYWSYKQIFTLSKSLKGEEGMYERLEEIFSELLIEVSNREANEQTAKKNKKKTINKKSKNSKV